jgi:hypothetical protein
MISNEKAPRPRPGFYPGKDCTEYVALTNAQRASRLGSEPCVLPDVGAEWKDAPLLPAWLAGCYYVVTHGGTRRSCWRIEADTLRSSLPTARTQYVNALACRRRGAVVLLDPGGLVLAARLCERRST